MQFLCCQITENVWKNSGFWKVTKDSYALIQIYRLITDLQLVVSFKFFRVTFSKGEVANIFNKQELVDSVSPYKRLIFPLSCPDYPSCRPLVFMYISFITVPIYIDLL